jgi:glucokinase
VIESRPPLLLGIEIGGTKLQLGLGRGDGRFLALARRTVEREAGGAGIREQILRAIGPLRDEAGAGPIAAVGIGFGGPVDASRGVVLTSNQIAGWDDFDLAGWAREALGVERVVLHNDADAAALGEARFGAGIGLSPILYVTIGSGIGGGLVAGGSIYRGAGLGAVEIGQLWVADESRPDGPPTLERTASGWAIGDAARAAFGPEATARDVADAARAGHPEALAILARAADAMGHALALAANLLAPRRIILGGGVSLMGEGLWFEPIRRAMGPRVFPPFRGRFDVVPAALGESVVVHGAVALALDAAERGR